MHFLQKMCPHVVAYGSDTMPRQTVQMHEKVAAGAASASARGGAPVGCAASPSESDDRTTTVPTPRAAAAATAAPPPTRRARFPAPPPPCALLRPFGGAAGGGALCMYPMMLAGATHVHSAPSPTLLHTVTIALPPPVSGAARTSCPARSILPDLPPDGPAPRHRQSTTTRPARMG